jgi:hypothetical protein
LEIADLFLKKNGAHSPRAGLYLVDGEDVARLFERASVRLNSTENA